MSQLQGRLTYPTIQIKPMALMVALSTVLIGIMWSVDDVLSGNLITSVDRFAMVEFFETRYLYAYLHVFILIPVLSLSFDRKVHYYKKWKYLFPAIAIVGMVFIIWDIYFTEVGVWGFNHDYFASHPFLSLPLEEWMFFVSVPFAVVFIYECWTCYIKTNWFATVESYLTPILAITFLAIGVLYWGNIYTATTFLLTGVFLLYHYLFLPSAYRARFYITYAISWIPFMLVNGVLTGGFTQEPVVMYNPEEYLGIRIISVPLDDSIYSFLLILANISLYEHFRGIGEAKKNVRKK
ncbi:MAG: lycopene cyclase domain-containing protein [Bacteroidota bacterium]